MPVSSTELVSPLSTYLLIQFSALLNLLSKFLDGSVNANVLLQGASPSTASRNIKLRSLLSALQKINTLAKQVRQYPRTNLCLEEGGLRPRPKGE